MALGGIISAVTLTGIFAYLIARLASAMLKNKLGPQVSDDISDANARAAALANTINNEGN